MSETFIRVTTERGIEQRKVTGTENRGGVEVPIPELRPGEILLPGPGGEIRISSSRVNRCAACAAWLLSHGVKCAKLEAGGML